MDVVLVATGPAMGQVFQLTDDRPMVIGRHGRSLKLRDTRISRHHAHFIKRDGHWYIEDLNSSNGTFVNGKRVKKSVQLRGGEKIQVGRTVLVFTHIEPEVEQEPAPRKAGSSASPPAAPRPKVTPPPKPEPALTMPADADEAGDPADAMHDTAEPGEAEDLEPDLGLSPMLDSVPDSDDTRAGDRADDHPSPTVPEMAHKPPDEDDDVPVSEVPALNFDEAEAMAAARPVSPAEADTPPPKVSEADDPISRLLAMTEELDKVLADDEADLAEDDDPPARIERL